MPMRLSLFTDYAFRLLIHLAARTPDLVTIDEAADAFSISRNHLAKIAGELSRGGFIETVRGRAGGLRLARTPRDITAGAVARLTERSIPLVECFDRANNACVITPACTLKTVLASAENAFYAVLDAYTLADMTRDWPQMRARLG